MFYREILPPANLSKYIDRYFLLGVHRNEKIPSEPDLVIPDGTYGMLFIQNEMIRRYPAENKVDSKILKSSYIFGQKSKPVYYAFDKDSTLSFGIKIKPAGLKLICNIPGKELIDKVVDTTDILNGTFRELERRIYDTTNFREKIILMNNFFLAKSFSTISAPQTMLINILDMIHSQLGQLNLNTITETFGISYKKLERLFDRDVGLNPKTYIRIIRFNSTLHLNETMGTTNLTKLAFNSGYYDQNHFIKDVKHFTNLTPKEYYKLGGSSLQSFHRNSVAQKMRLKSC